MTVCNLLRKAPSSYSIGKRIFLEIKKYLPNFQPKSFLDFGSGLGPFAWAFNEVFPDC
jgi:ribosomal protein RSM22 (predicted rRNA methylase)